jgi:hypothetical protein
MVKGYILYSVLQYCVSSSRQDLLLSRPGRVKRYNYPQDTMSNGRAGGRPAEKTFNPLNKGNIVYKNELKIANGVNMVWLVFAMRINAGDELNQR